MSSIMIRRCLATFQSTRPRRARRLKSTAVFDAILFQSTRPRRARPTVADTSRWLPLFQSTRPRRARPVRRGLCFGMALVSIHAPAEGATLQQLAVHCLCVSFNPRARGGRDLPSSSVPRMSVCFNPRARGGRDHGTSGTCRRWRCFNPRARGGRDPPVQGLGLGRHSFNPRARGGRDSQPLIVLPVTMMFQSTRPRRARPAKHRALWQVRHVSIHAPAEGATCAEPQPQHDQPGTFQSTRPRRARLSHHNSLIRRTVPVALREPNACCQ